MSQPLDPNGPPAIPAIPLDFRPMPMPPPRLRGWPKGLAITAIVLGSIGLMGVCGLPQYFVDIGPPNPVIQMIRNDAVLFDMNIASLAIGIVLSAFLLAGGIMCLRLNPAGRKILVGVLSMQLLLGLIGMVVNLAILLPRIMSEAAKHPGSPIWWGALVGSYGGAIFGVLIWIFYAWMLYVFTRAATRAQFEQSPGQPFPPAL